MLIQPPISQVEECVFPVIPDRLASFALALQYQLEWSQWLDPQALLELQMQQLRGVLLHALQAVPYYRSTFEKTGLCSIPENISMEFLHQLPVLSRTDVQTAGKNLYSTSIPAKHGQIYKLETSGSSGTPVRVLGTRLTQVLWRVFAIRELAWNKTDFSLKLCVIRRAKKQTGAPPPRDYFQGMGTNTRQIIQARSYLFSQHCLTPGATSTVVVKKQT